MPTLSLSCNRARARARCSRAVGHDGAQCRSHGRLEGGCPSLVDVDEVHEGAEHAGHVGQLGGAGRATLLRHLPGQRLGARLEAVAATLGVA